MADKILEPDTSLTESERIMALTELLKPCPCCGGKSEIFASHFRWGSGQALFYGYLARCLNPQCGVETAFFEHGIEAVYAWNRRTNLKEEAVYHESVTPDPKETFFLIPHCPCCGGAAHVRTPSFGWIGEIGKFSIVCSNSDWCGFGTREHDELLYAVEEWNRRTDYQL